MNISCKLVQFAPTSDVDHNLSTIISHLRSNMIVIYPEACLSGYSSTMDKEFLYQLDPQVVDKAIKVITDHCNKQRGWAIFGTLYHNGSTWLNSGFVIGPDGVISRYDKVNLATNERGVLEMGMELDPIMLKIGGESQSIALQLCRELKYPEQWRLLSQKGATLLVHLNNAVGDTSEQRIWKSQLIARATENQRFVISVNAAGEQKSPTMVISPKGVVLFEADGTAQDRIVDIDISEVSNWYLNQCAIDVVDIVEK